MVSTTYSYLAVDVKPGDRILLDDGLLELKVKETDGKQVLTQVVVGGVLKAHKGINLPGVNLRANPLTPKDLEDLAFGLKNGVDYIALSFVRRPEDIQLARQSMERLGRRVPIIAKLEKPEALAQLDPIIALADGIMVARGDLGVEIPPENVPRHPEADRAQVQRARHSGDHRHPDAELHDRQPPPDPGGGLGCGQRHLRRYGRGHALG